MYCNSCATRCVSRQLHRVCNLTLTQVLEGYVSLSPTYVCKAHLHSDYIPYVNTRVAHDIQSVYPYVRYPLVLVVCADAGQELDRV